LEPYFIFDPGNRLIASDVKVGWTTFKILAETASFFMPIDAVLLLKKADKVRSDPNILIKNRDAFLRLSEGITENDNPILLVGKVKK